MDKPNDKLMNRLDGSSKAYTDWMVDKLKSWVSWLVSTITGGDSSGTSGSSGSNGTSGTSGVSSNGTSGTSGSNGSTTQNCSQIVLKKINDQLIQTGIFIDIGLQFNVISGNSYAFKFYIIYSLTNTGNYFEKLSLSYRLFHPHGWIDITNVKENPLVIEGVYKCNQSGLFSLQVNCQMVNSGHSVLEKFGIMPSPIYVPIKTLIESGSYLIYF